MNTEAEIKMRYPFFTNRKCEFFPCHGDIDTRTFNCAFCYCPLYTLGPDCGGDFIYTDEGVKSCRNCTRPHEETAGIDLVAEHWAQLRDLAKRQD